MAGGERVFPERIVSLVPSLTEALFVFGAGDRVVGCTRYCTEPPEGTARLTKVGGTRKFSVAKVLGLKPDLVIAVKEENDRGQIEDLIASGVPVLIGEPRTVEDALGFLQKLARRAGAPEAEAVLAPLERVRRSLRESMPEPRRVFVPIWKDPYMTVGGDTYVHDVLRLCGGENVFGERRRYPQVTLEEIEAASPEVMLLPDEPYDFGDTDLAELRGLYAPASRHGRLHLVDGRDLTWYGPRMAEGLRRISTLIRA